jgi:hypothetical protein
VDAAVLYEIQKLLTMSGQARRSYTTQSTVIADPIEARSFDLNRQFGAVSRSSARARRLRRLYRSVKLPVLIATLCGVVLASVLATM